MPSHLLFNKYYDISVTRRADIYVSFYRDLTNTLNCSIICQYLTWQTQLYLKGIQSHFPPQDGGVSEPISHWLNAGIGGAKSFVSVKQQDIVQASPRPAFSSTQVTYLPEGYRREHAEHQDLQRELPPGFVPENCRPAGARTGASGNQKVQQPGDVVRKIPG